MENNWFNEGFNDYIAIYTLARSGLLDNKEFLSHVNDKNLRPHYTSPVGTMPGDSIMQNFFKSHFYEKLPYQRGFIYAFYLDNQIRIASGGKQTIRNFLLKLYDNNKQNKNKPITIDDFTSAIATFLPKLQVKKEIEEYMLKGTYIDFRKVKLIDAFQVRFNNNLPELSLSEAANLKKLYN